MLIDGTHLARSTRVSRENGFPSDSATICDCGSCSGSSDRVFSMGEYLMCILYGLR